MIIANIICYILVLVGALNWGVFGIFDFNLVGWVFGGGRSVGAIIVYVLVALAAIWLIISPIVTGRGLLLAPESRRSRDEKTVTESN
ncbi:MAG: DUF378 domain-containing protein [Clostridia bacterium]|nr:DUF378 domain-containing protein [Clostridia bacterium]